MMFLIMIYGAIIFYLGVTVHIGFFLGALVVLLPFGTTIAGVAVLIVIGKFLMEAFL